MTDAPRPMAAAEHRLVLPDGTIGYLHGPLTPSVPLVVLLHGFAGGLASLTAPRAGVRSWREALLAAGYSTLSYPQVAPLGTLAPNVEQLLAVAAGPLSDHRPVRRLPLVLLTHSRGGLLARSFVQAAAARHDLHGLLARIGRVITLHAPHAGSGLAGLALRVDAGARRLHALVASLGLRPGVLAGLCAFSASPAVAELAPGSRLLRSLARRPSAAGVEWHTFGGTSADLGRMRTLLGGPAAADGPGAQPSPGRLAHTRGLGELLGLLDRLALLTPALRDGEGDLVVADAAARLPGAPHTSNPIDHVGALWDRGLQEQALAVLAGGRWLSAA
ncbi:MAG: hypothetical protein KBG85_03935 [Micropruina sp.]|nr:hypothetical protein [Micropruina sp.]